MVTKQQPQHKHKMMYSTRLKTSGSYNILISIYITGVSCSLPLGLTPPVGLRGHPPGLSTLGSPPCSLSYRSLYFLTLNTSAPPAYLLRHTETGAHSIRNELPGVGDRGHVQVREPSHHHAGSGARRVAWPGLAGDGAEHAVEAGHQEHGDDAEADDEHNSGVHVLDRAPDVSQQGVGLHGALDVEREGGDLLTVHVLDGERDRQLLTGAHKQHLISEVNIPGRYTEDAKARQDSEINDLISDVISKDICQIYVMASCSLSVLFVQSISSVCRDSPPSHALDANKWANF